MWTGVCTIRSNLHWRIDNNKNCIVNTMRSYSTSQDGRLALRNKLYVWVRNICMGKELDALVDLNQQPQHARVFDSTSHSCDHGYVTKGSRKATTQCVDSDSSNRQQQLKRHLCNCWNRTFLMSRQEETACHEDTDHGYYTSNSNAAT